jgi:hypothetical protein
MNKAGKLPNSPKANVVRAAFTRPATGFDRLEDLEDPSVCAIMITT